MLLPDLPGAAYQPTSVTQEPKQWRYCAAGHDYPVGDKATAARPVGRIYEAMPIPLDNRTIQEPFCTEVFVISRRWLVKANAVGRKVGVSPCAGAEDARNGRDAREEREQTRDERQEDGI